MSDFYNPLEVRKGVKHYADLDAPVTFSQGNWGALIKHINKEVTQEDFEGNDITDLNRKLILMWITTPDDEALVDPLEWSTNNMTPQEKNGVKRWVQARKSNGEWLPRRQFGAEARWILNCAHFDQSRTTLTDTGFVMSDYLKFWKEHLPPIDFAEEQGEVTKSTLHLGGIPVDEETPLFERTNDYIEQVQQKEIPKVNEPAIAADASDIMPL